MLAARRSIGPICAGLPAFHSLTCRSVWQKSENGFVPEKYPPPEAASKTTGNIPVNRSPGVQVKQTSAALPNEPDLRRRNPESAPSPSTYPEKFSALGIRIAHFTS